MDIPANVFIVLPNTVLPESYAACVTELLLTDGLQPRRISDAMRLAAKGDKRRFTVRWEGKLRWYPEFEKNVPFENIVKIVAINGVEGVRVSDTTCSRASRFPDLRSVELSVKTYGDWCLADFFAMRHLARGIGVFTEQAVRRHMHVAGVVGYVVLDYDEGLPFRIDCCRDDCTRCAEFAEPGEDMDDALGWRWYCEEDEELRMAEDEARRSRKPKRSVARDIDERQARRSSDSVATVVEPKRRREDSEEMRRRENESRKRFLERLRKEKADAERRRKERESKAKALPRRLASKVVVV